MTRFTVQQAFSNFGVTGIEQAGVPGTPCVVLLSGGLDSVVTLALVEKAEFKPYPLFINYGQSNLIEWAYARAQAAALNLELREVEIRGLSQLAPYCQMLNSKEGDKFDRVSDVNVPGRMPLFMSIASMYMSLLNTPYLAVGIQSEGLLHHHADASGQFTDLMEEALASAIGSEAFTCFTPLLEMRKKQIAVLAAHLGIALENTYSCLVGGEKHCGACTACAPGGIPWRS